MMFNAENLTATIARYTCLEVSDNWGTPFHHWLPIKTTKYLDEFGAPSGLRTPDILPN